MEMKELMEFIETEDKRLNEHYGKLLPPDKRVLARTVKMMEELGELCDDVLAQASLQRKKKLDAHDREKMEEEFADVIFTALLLAKTMGIDVGSAMKRKMKKVKKRKYDE
jgi:NTP pyrophosphatase (non-canonical NTP hydrolase)